MKKLFNKKNPLFLLILSALLLVSTIIVPAKTAQAVTDEVSLYYLDGDYRTHGLWYDNIYIKVKNLSYEKNVYVHYTYSSDNGEWKDATATFVKSLDANYDIFKVTVDGFGELEYCINYNVNGKDYVDNNNGQNYTHDITLGSAPIYADRFSSCQSLDVLVKDFNDPNAKVEVTYTTDNWNTVQTKALNYCSTTNNGELYYGCSLDIPYNTPTDGFEFAVSYTVNGVTYWDNNFDQNYNYANHHSIC